MAQNHPFEKPLDQGVIIVSPQESTLVDILKQKFEEGKSYVTISVTTFTVYLAINGALLKFSLERDAGTTIPIILSIVGIATSVLYIAVSVFKKLVRDSLASDIEHLNKLLGSPLTCKQFSGLSYISIGTGSFSLFGLIGWILLLIRFLSHWWRSP